MAMMATFREPLLEHLWLSRGWAVFVLMLARAVMRAEAAVFTRRYAQPWRVTPRHQLERVKVKRVNLSCLNCSETVETVMCN